MPMVSCLRQLGVCYEFMVGQHSISSPKGFKILRTEFSIADLALMIQSNDLTSSFLFFLRWSYKGKGQRTGKEGGNDLGIILVLPPFPLLIPYCQDATRHQVLLYQSTTPILPCLPPLLSLPIQVTIIALWDCRNRHQSGLPASLLPLYSPFSIKTSRFLKNAQQSMALPCYITFNGSPAPWHYSKTPWRPWARKPIWWHPPSDHRPSHTDLLGVLWLYRLLPDMGFAQVFPSQAYYSWTLLRLIHPEFPSLLKCLLLQETFSDCLR